jgi:uncharacterized protein
LFIGRENELQTLEKLYRKDIFQLMVIYGRRRIGKTTIINKFIENKEAIFFVAQEANDFINLEVFSQKIYSFFNIPLSTGSFKTWNNAFDFIAEKAKHKKFILAIDEFPYAVHENKSIKSVLQNVIDHKLKNTNIFIILCGSQISFMENEVLGHKSPLFGRRTSQMRVEGFDYLDAAKFMDGYNYEDKIKFYSCIGGTPHYLSQIDRNLSFEENIKELFFDIAGYLYDEPMMLLKQELRETSMYNSIITSIAAGCSKLNEISTKINEHTSKTIKYIDTLIDLNILYKEFPFGQNPAKSRKGVYKISDNCFNFWYRFVFLNKPGIEQGIGDIILKNEVVPLISNYIGKPSFEEICKQYILRLNKNEKLPLLSTNFGSWWGVDKIEKKQSDIDIVAENKFNKQILFGECKWRNNINHVDEINKLLNKNHLIPNYKEYYYMFFSKIPYSNKSKKLEKDFENLKLVVLDDLFNV